MAAEGVTLLLLHGVLEDGAENVGGDVGPVVVPGGAAKLIEFVDLELDGCGLGEDAAVEIGNILETTAGDAAFLAHGGEETVEEVEGLFEVFLAIVEELGDEVLG